MSCIKLSSFARASAYDGAPGAGCVEGVVPAEGVAASGSGTGSGRGASSEVVGGPAREGKDSIEKEKNEWNSHGLTQVAGYEKLPSIS